MTDHDSSSREYGNQPLSAKELAETYVNVIHYVSNRYTSLNYRQLVTLKEVLDQIEDEYNALDSKETDDSPIDGYNRRKVGRRPLYSEENTARILELYEEGVAMHKIAEQVGCSYGRVQAVVKKDKKSRVPLHERREADWDIYLKLCRTEDDD